MLILLRGRQILNHLVLAYFATETADNHELRQCLSYFIPVYCYSNPKNQRRVGNVRLYLSLARPSSLAFWNLTASSCLQIFLQSLTILKGVYDDLDDKASMVTPLQIGLQLIDWTDPQKAV